MKKLTAILIGAGNRGVTYTDIMHEMPEQYQVVAVADPEPSRRNHVQQLHNIPEELCFDNYESLLSKGKIADFAVIATQDRMHFAPAMKAIALGYDLLLEKPISPDAKECEEIAKAAESKNVKVIVCTVLRYTPVFGTVKEIIRSGKIGQVVHINLEECVGNVHQSHSFVRGRWGNTQRSSFMLLAKSCHDMDLLAWLIGKKCKKVQSFGALSYFCEANAPKDAPERCIQGCPHGEVCPYNAVKLYLQGANPSFAQWFRTTSTLKQDPTDEDVEKVMWETQYGKCVFRCDNDVVDHQCVNLQFEDNVTASFTMNAHTRGGRFLHVCGTKGEIHAALSGTASYVKLYDFETCQETEQTLCSGDGVIAGHGGGDCGIVRSVYAHLAEGKDLVSIPTIAESSRNHLIAFAAEASRLSGQVVDMDSFAKSLN